MSTFKSLDLDICLQPKQADLWRLWNDSEVTRIGFGGARGGAKSGGGRRCMLLRRLRYPRTTGLILRRTYPDLDRSHILKLFEEYPALRSWYNEQKKCLTCPNGSRLFFGSAEHAVDLAAFYSQEYADIMPDEAQEFSQGELESLSATNRCTSNGDIQPKMIFTFMPGVSETGIPPRGLPYLKRVFADNDQRGVELNQKWAFIQAFSWDNIEWARKELEHDGVDENEFYSWDNDTRRYYFVTRTEYGKVLQSLTNQSLRDAWLYGKWDVFQGQYFPNFRRERHVISPAEAKERIKPWHKRWASGDWGYDHPHDIQWHAEDEWGRVITYREMWGREKGETELGKEITERSAGEKIKAFPFSWDAGKLSKRSSKQFPKSSSQMINDALGKNVAQTFPADSSPGSRISGWRLLSNLLDADGGPPGQETAMWQMVEGECDKLIECLPSLVRDPDNTEDVLKVDFSENQIGDDPADCARMGLQYEKSASIKPFAIVRQEVLAEAAKAAPVGNIAQARFLADLNLKEQHANPKKQWQRRDRSDRLRRGR